MNKIKKDLRGLAGGAILKLAQFFGGEAIHHINYPALDWLLADTHAQFDVATTLLAVARNVTVRAGFSFGHFHHLLFKVLHPLYQMGFSVYRIIARYFVLQQEAKLKLDKVSAYSSKKQFGVIYA